MGSFRDEGDAELLAGGAEAFGRFYLRHEDPILAFFLRRTRSAELAADLTAETFARALQGKQRFDASLGEASMWLFGIAKHVLSESLRRGRVQDDVRRRLGLQRLELDDDSLSRIDQLTGGLASQALGQLPEEQRLAVAKTVSTGCVAVKACGAAKGPLATYRIPVRPRAKSATRRKGHLESGRCTSRCTFTSRSARMSSPASR